MRTRTLVALLAVLVAATLVAGCGSHRAMTKAETDQAAAISAKIAKAESWGAQKCAPKELANAQADLDSARHEATESWETAATYFAKADKSADALLKKAETCLTPEVSFSAVPNTVEPGKCSTLKWTTQYVKKASIEGIGDVPVSGSKEVCPPASTKYELTAAGPGGTIYEYAAVTVAEPMKMAPPPPPPPPPPPVMAPVAPKPAKISLHVNFDTAKYTIRPADLAELQKAIQFVKDHPDAKIHLVGYTDSRGGDKYNQKLSEQRANAVKKYIEGEVSIAPEKISAEGKGKADPIGDNKTKEGQFQNRRVEILATQ